jgi:hypothetical protein
VEPFNAIATYRLTYPDCCGLANPETAAEIFSDSALIDSLSHYTAEMWDMLTDVVLTEWFGLRLPPSKLPWAEPLYLPNDLRLLYCLNQTYARQAKSDIRKRYLSLKREPPDLSIFAGYGITVLDDFQRERDGLRFLARQADHFRSTNDYLFIVQTVYPHLA